MKPKKHKKAAQPSRPEKNATRRTLRPALGPKPEITKEKTEVEQPSLEQEKFPLPPEQEFPV
jgi:hypothetical protein